MYVIPFTAVLYCIVFSLRDKGLNCSIHKYSGVPSKCPWALGVHGQELGVGIYTKKPFVCVAHIHMYER